MSNRENLMLELVKKMRDKKQGWTKREKERVSVCESRPSSLSHLFEAAPPYDEELAIFYNLTCCLPLHEAGTKPPPPSRQSETPAAGWHMAVGCHTEPDELIRPVNTPTKPQPQITAPTWDCVSLSQEEKAPKPQACKWRISAACDCEQPGTTMMSTPLNVGSRTETLHQLNARQTMNLWVEHRVLIKWRNHSFNDVSWSLPSWGFTWPLLLNPAEVHLCTIYTYYLLCLEPTGSASKIKMRSLNSWIYWSISMFCWTVSIRLSRMKTLQCQKSPQSVSGCDDGSLNDS